MQTVYSNVKVTVSEPLVAFRETVVYRNLKKTRNAVKKESEDEEEESDEDKRYKKVEYDEDTDVLESKREDHTEDSLRIFKRNEEMRKKYAKVAINTEMTNNRGAKQQSKVARGVNTLNVKDQSNKLTVSTANGKIKLVVKCVAFPFSFAQWMHTHKDLLDGSESNNKAFLKELINHPMDKQLSDMIANHTVSFGPNRNGPNILIVDKYPSPIFKGQTGTAIDKQVINHLISGFDIATNQGPLCDEPMMGVCMIVQSVEMNSEEQSINLFDSTQVIGKDNL